MKYLVFASFDAAQEVVANATALVPGLPGPGGSAIWRIIMHNDGRAAIVIPETSAGAGLDLTAQEYEDLLPSELFESLENAEDLDESWFPSEDL